MGTQVNENLDLKFEKIKKELQTIGERNPCATVTSTKNTIFAQFEKRDEEGHHLVELTVTKEKDHIIPFLNGGYLVEDEWIDLEKALNSFKAVETMFFS